MSEPLDLNYDQPADAGAPATLADQPPSPKGGFLANEPVVSASAIAAVLAWVGGFLVTRGYITSTQASSLTQDIAPVIAAALPLIIGAIARRFVVPVHKVEHMLATTGLMTDADFARIEALLLDKLKGDVTVNIAGPPSDTVPAPPAS